MREKGTKKEVYEEEQKQLLYLQIACVPFLNRPYEYVSHINDRSFLTDIVKEDCRGAFMRFNREDIACEIINYGYDIREQVENKLLDYYVIQGD